MRTKTQKKRQKFAENKKKKEEEKTTKKKETKALAKKNTVMSNSSNVMNFIMSNSHMFPNKLNLENLSEYLDIIASVHIEGFTHEDMLAAFRQMVRRNHSPEDEMTSMILLSVINRSALDTYMRLRRQYKQPVVASCVNRLSSCFRYRRHKSVRHL